MTAPSPTISIIVPTYFRDPHQPGVRAGLGRFLRPFEDLARQADIYGTDLAPRFEVLLCDSGPTTHALAIRSLLAALLERAPALEACLRYLHQATDDGPLSRAAAMNWGVQESRGRIVLFLHLDCQLPDDALAHIVASCAKGRKAGAFLKEYEGKQTLSLLQLTERYLNHVRTLLTRQVVGTNAIFMTKELALNHPYQGDFLEDVELSDWLKRNLSQQEFTIIHDSVKVSARKYSKHGELPSIAINGAVMLLYRIFDADPNQLKRDMYHYAFPQGPKFWLTWGQKVARIAGQSLLQRLLPGSKTKTNTGKQS